MTDLQAKALTLPILARWNTVAGSAEFIRAMIQAFTATAQALQGEHASVMDALVSVQPMALSSSSLMYMDFVLRRTSMENVSSALEVLSPSSGAPLARIKIFNLFPLVAQMVEHVAEDHGVAGSKPAQGANFTRTNCPSICPCSVAGQHP